MAPMAARRAHPVQRSRSQGLRGNRDACHPRRGVVGPSYGSFAFGQARKLIPSAGPPLPTEPASLGFGGGPNYRKRQPIGRAAMHARSLPCPYNPPPPTAHVLGGVPGAHPRHLLFPHFFGKKWGPRPGRPAPRGGHPGKRAARQGCRALQIRSYRASGYGDKRADDIRPYGCLPGMP